MVILEEPSMLPLVRDTVQDSVDSEDSVESLERATTENLATVAFTASVEEA